MTMVPGAETTVVGALRTALEAVAREGNEWLNRQGMNFLDRRIAWSADIRYLGQSFDLNVALDQEVLADASGAEVRRRFNSIYEQVYGYKDEAAALEVLDARATAVGVTLKPRIESVAASGPGAQSGAAPTSRRIFLDGRHWEARVYSRTALVAGSAFSGPAIVEQYDTTTLVPHGFAVTVDSFGNLIGETQNGI